MITKLWQFARVDPDTMQIAIEIKESGLRSVIYAVGVSGGLLYILGNMTGLWVDVPRLSAVLLVLLAASFAGLTLSRRSLNWARLAWLLGIALVMLTAALLFRELPIYWLFSLLPLLAVVACFNLVWGLGGAGLGVLLLALLSWLPGQATISPQNLLLMTFISLVSLVVLWTFVRSMISIADWAMVNYQKSREELEELRGERVEWRQTKEDYDLVTRELARLTSRLEAMTQIAEEARRVKEEFVANVSHELRTPLNMILGFSEVIMKSPQAYGDVIPPALLADIAAIERNSQHLSRLVDDVLDLSQIEAGRMALMKEWVDIPTIIAEAISTVRFLYESKKLYLREEIAGGIPEVFCDGTRIRQVLINLLSNAGRFTEKGGVTVRAWLEETGLVMAVADSGPGISAEDQNKIFQPFRQLQSTLHGHKGGSGLGLSISKQFVEMHGGKMWLESMLGKGTTFFFNVPLKPPGDELDGAESRRWFNPYYQYEARSRPSRVSAPEVKARFVLLEEEDTLQKYLRRYMEDVDLVGVKNVNDAIVELRRSPAQGLIYNTPQARSGSLLAGRLSELPYGTPVITCWVPGREEAVRQLGVVEYLVKPVGREALMRAIHKVNHGEVSSLLLVDDEPEILQLYARVLAADMPSARLMQAMNGTRALHLMRERRPDVVLLDLIMPGKDGFQVLQEKALEEEIRDIPVIVVSSRNPSGETAVSDTLSVARGSGLSLHELIEFIRETSRILTPAKRSGGR
jgi:signal transduction histidine kinase/CheY-like chemotaxis protein